MSQPESIRRIADAVWELPVAYKKGMKTPARIIATDELLATMEAGVFEQIANVAMLPGIVKHPLCMPDGHWGYGFPIGGVAAMDADNGVISPGGIGFDINCGMRLVATSLTLDEVRPRIETLIDRLFAAVPTGAGSGGVLAPSAREFDRIMVEGAAWCVDRGYGWREDLERTEENGCFRGADPAKVSARARERGISQLGSLGSGNHYLEIQVALPEHVFDSRTAAVFGVHQPDQIMIMFHCGSRGFGHQIAADYIQAFARNMEPRYGITVPDRNLACAPIASSDGQDYDAAMKCAVNMAFANRQAILHRVREVFAEVFGRDPAALGMHQVYDVTHNTAKRERHIIDGTSRELLVHRKGSTRAFAPGMKGIPDVYRVTGQPVIIGGSMETGSYVLAGARGAAETFYSTTHGSGRVMSRRQAKKTFRGRDLIDRMRMRGMYVRSASYAGLAEEAGGAYKDIDAVTRAAQRAGISRPVARFTPIGTIKG